MQPGQTTTKRQRIDELQEAYGCSRWEARRCELIDRIGHLPAKSDGAKKRQTRKRRRRRQKLRAAARDGV